jgi:hypothetical protein
MGLEPAVGTKFIITCIVATWLVACATGVGDPGASEDEIAESGGAGSGGDPDDPGDGGDTGSGNSGNMPMGSGGAGATPGSGGDAGPVCDPPNHLCGGICVGNTPQTGCYQSQSCTACPTPTNGSATCAADGTCAAMCNAPYVAQGASCVCPQQCCSNNDCGGGATCQNGTCVQPMTCDQVLCTALCLVQGKFGLCQGNTCLCL